MLKTAVAIRHVHFEDLGTFEAVLTAGGYHVDYRDVGTQELGTLDPLVADILIVLGGPVGVYDSDLFPFLSEERRILSERIAADKPTVGICLGAQQIAASLGARVAPAGHKEIGFSPLNLTEAGRAGPLRHLEGSPVLHWHGDSFETPDGAQNLASTALCATQAFSLGRNVLGLQFHPEVDVGAGIERWLVGHSAELASAYIDPRELREDAVRIGSRLRNAAQRMFAEWLEALSP